MKMKFLTTGLYLSVALIMLSALGSGQQPTLADPLLENMIGKWVLSGEITGRPTTHDVEATWVLNHQFVHLHERSRERKANGLPAYEADVFLGWDEKNKQYVAHWIDVFGGGFSLRGFAPRQNNNIPFIFSSPDGDFHTTFTYDEQEHAWQWAMDSEDAGKLHPFARLRMVKGK